MPIVYIPSPLDLQSPSVRAEYERLSKGLERAIDTRDLDLYNAYYADMCKFYRKYLGRNYG